MMQESMARLFELILLCAAGAGLIGVALSSMYDLQAVACRRNLNDAVQKLRRKSAQPPLTVLVYTYNDAETIAGCLEALRQSRYRNYDVVVVDNASQDGTRRAVRAFMRRHPRFTVRFYAKRKHSPRREALRLAYRRSRQAELVVTLAASTRPARGFLAAAAARFAVEPSLKGLSVGERHLVPVTIVSSLPDVARSAERIYMKTLSLLKLRRGQADINGIYRRDLIVSGERAAIRYEGALVLPAAQHERQPETAWQQPILTAAGAVLLLMMTYAMIMAASLLGYQPLVMGWLLVVVSSLIAAWSDESMNMMRKLQLTFAVPLMYFLLYVALLRFVLEPIIYSVPVRLKPTRPRQQWYVRRRAIS